MQPNDALSPPADPSSSTQSHPRPAPVEPQPEDVSGLEIKRASLITQRQAEMDSSFHRHDTLVREYFHLKKWVSLVQYNPTTAKYDESNVFKEFRAMNGLDLLTHSVDQNTRTTRRSRQAKLEAMSNASAPPTRSSLTSRKKGQKQKTTAQSSNGQTWGVIADSSTSVRALPRKSSKAIITPRNTFPSQHEFTESVSARSSLAPELVPPDSPLTELSSLTTVSPPRQPSELSYIETTLHQTTTMHPSNGTGPLKLKRGHLEPLSIDADDIRPETPAISTPGAGSSVPTGLSSESSLVHTPVEPPAALRKHPRSPEPFIPLHVSESPITQKKSSKNAIQRPSKRRKITHSGQPNESTPSVEPPGVIPPPRIQRVKLVMRKPVSGDPTQLPTKLGLRKYLASIKEGADVKKYKRSIKHGWGEVDKFTRKYRPHPKTQAYIDFLSGEADVIEDQEDLYDSTNAYKDTLTPKRQSKDIWDLVVEEVITRREQDADPTRKVAARLAEEASACYLDRRIREEKRVKELAKQTINLVAEQWRKAVLQIREYEKVSAEGVGYKPRRKRNRLLGDKSDDSDFDSNDDYDSDDEIFMLPETNDTNTHTNTSDPIELATPSDHHKHGPPTFSHVSVDLSHTPRPNFHVPITTTSLDHQEPAIAFQQLGSQPFLTGFDDEDSSTLIEFNTISAPYRPPQPASSASIENYGDGWRSQTPELSLENLLLNSRDHSPMLLRSPEPSPSTLFNEATISALFDSPQKDEAPALLGFYHPTTPVRDDTALRGLAVVGGVERRSVSSSLNTDYVPVIPDYLKPYSVTPVAWNSRDKIGLPVLLKGELRPYQSAGLQWLAGLHMKKLNGILADAPGLGKSVQTIALLAHLACDRGIWGPHLIVAPTSTIPVWQSLFAEFCPSLKVVTCHDNPQQRRKTRNQWNDKHAFNVCLTTYSRASADAELFMNKDWYYLISDGTHRMNFESQRWRTITAFKSLRRLMLSAVPLQDNLRDLCSILRFLSVGSSSPKFKDLGDWSLNLCKDNRDISNGLADADDQRVIQLQQFLAPYILRRTAEDVAPDLPKKREEIVYCPLSRLQRVLYKRISNQANLNPVNQTVDISLRLRRVWNHPSLLEPAIVTPYALRKSVIADYEVTDLLRRRRWFHEFEETFVPDLFGLRFIEQEGTSWFSTDSIRRARSRSFIQELPGEPPPVPTLLQFLQPRYPIFSLEMLKTLSTLKKPSQTIRVYNQKDPHPPLVAPPSNCVQLRLSASQRLDSIAHVINHFTFVTLRVIAPDIPRAIMKPYEDVIMRQNPDCGGLCHIASKLCHSLPEPHIPEHNCGKLQHLTQLLREKRETGHRVLLLTSMHQMLDILERTLRAHSHTYLRLDGFTQPEERRYVLDRFNMDSQVFCLIASSRSITSSIRITGASTIIFYDSDIDQRVVEECKDLVNRTNQSRDLHIYRLVSDETIEDIVTYETILGSFPEETTDDEDLRAAAVTMAEEAQMERADILDFDDAPNYEQVDESLTVADYMVSFVLQNPDMFEDWEV